MSNLPAKLTVNLPSQLRSGNFEGFTAHDRKEFTLGGAGALDLKVECQVGIIPAPAGQNKVIVEIDADPADRARFDISQRGDTVSVEQESSAISMRVSGGDINISGGTVHISGMSFGAGSTVTINGRVISGDVGSPATRMARILISAPQGSDLFAKLSGHAELVSLPPHKTANVSLSGQSRAALAAVSVEADVSGQSSVRAVVGTGELRADVSGQSSIEAQGQFSKVVVDASGQSTIRTEGAVAGAYNADASGMSRITHRGQISGRIRQDTSGMSKIFLG